MGKGRSGGGEPEEVEAKQAWAATGQGMETPGAPPRGTGWAGLSQLTSQLARQPASPGTRPGPVHPTWARLRSLQAPWPASPETPKPPNSTTPVSPFHHLFSPLPSSPATVHLLIHEALISSLFNFVLNRLTGMITTCRAVLPSPTNPVFRQQGSAGDRSAEPKSLSSCTSLSQNVTRSLESNLEI